LGLRDVQTLVNYIGSSDPSQTDMNVLLKDYRLARQKDRDHVIKLTDNLTRLFAPQVTPIKALRSMGLRMIANLPLAQRTVLRRNFGLRYL
jgi:2-polyprenyl-6-methoxyphenol hydroxylase-like FAD-dependent oxidoreductase